MAMPLDIDARRYYRVAYQRLEDGAALLEISRPRAAIYPTGYAIECILKTLLLMSTPPEGGLKFSLPFAEPSRITSNGSATELFNESDVFPVYRIDISRW